MSNWLEQAESVYAFGDVDIRLDERLEKKRSAIEKNYRLHHHEYDSIITQLKSLIDRINNLPVEFRHPYGKLNFHYKESKLNNRLHYVSSSYRIKKRLYNSIFRFFKQYTFKKVRVAYFTVSSEEGFIDIELKENLLLKVRMDREGKHEKIRRPRPNNSDRKDYRFMFDLNAVTVSVSREIIDWLAFKTEMEEVSFFEKEPQLSYS